MQCNKVIRILNSKLDNNIYYSNLFFFINYYFIIKLLNDELVNIIIIKLNGNFITFSIRYRFSIYTKCMHDYKNLFNKHI